MLYILTFYKFKESKLSLLLDRKNNIEK